MTTSLDKQLGELVNRASANCKKRGSKIVQAVEKASLLEIQWLQYLMQTQLTGTADRLLEGATSAIREGAACIALGLVRPALNSLRLQIDLSMGWLYFKDHPVEWQQVQSTGDGFMLKTALMKYLDATCPRYTTRFSILKDCKTRSQPDPYRLLSAHIHGQSEYVLPQVIVPADIVASTTIQDEAIAIQIECAEFINDVFWSVFMERWNTLPTVLMEALNGRFQSQGQKADFFKSE